MNQIALIVHRILDAPDHFRFKEIKDAPDGGISDGYHVVSMNGDFYYLGAARMQSTEAEHTTFLAAIKEWKRETGWQPTVVAPMREHPQPIMVPVDRLAELAHKEFERVVRSHHKSYSVHADATVFTAGVGQALVDLDAKLIPIKGTGDAKLSGVQGA